MRYNNFISIIVFLVSAALFAQEYRTAEEYGQMLDTILDHSVQEVSPKELLTLDNILYLDAREPEEFQVSHIEDAVCVGYDKFKLKNVKQLPKDQKIVVYCSIGYRSEKVAEKLVKAGFTDVSNLYGGIFEWAHEELPLVNPAKTQTDSIHTFDNDWAQWLRTGNKVQ